MRKILIADDEELIRKGLKAMIKRYRDDFYDIYLCSNGNQANEILDNENIDILITDIRMPESDGIELINHLKDFHKETAIIILSGYDDFKYAKEAIRCGAKDYLLKPVNREKLYLCMEDIEKEISKNEEYAQGYSSNLFNCLLQSETLSMEILSIIEKNTNMKIFNDYYICIYNITILDKSFINVIEENKYGKLIYFFNAEGWLVVITKEIDFVINLLGINVKSNYVVGISKNHTSIQTIKEAYFQSNETFRHRILSPKTILHYELIEKRNKKFTIDVNKINSIINMISSGRIDEIFKNIDELFNEKYVDELNVEYFIELSKLLKRKIFEIDNTFKIYSINGYPSIYEYISHLKECIFIVDQQLVNSRNTSANLAIKKSVEYINKNFSKDINLTIISNEVSLNYTYFCEQFKLYIGETFINYLKKIRVEKAIELLLNNSEYKVYEIANMVGYKDAKQFAKTFRKITGLSPIEYKHKYAL
ncbi:response regulator transcription factor [Clostridium lacusfryxellense]|uniref:response regulator transcription factor n=1 Tax=Clostridium lacusfryxellense TaxID=205328 RepID=UPI001C0C1368|nr:response regulator [Clostridium lacusfryxellense]MBU3111242.1 response regulator [Clostridium lacusfryxellense]